MLITFSSDFVIDNFNKVVYSVYCRYKDNLNFNDFDYMFNLYCVSISQLIAIKRVLISLCLIDEYNRKYPTFDFYVCFIENSYINYCIHERKIKNEK